MRCAALRVGVEKDMSGTEDIDKSLYMHMKKGFYIILGTIALIIGAIGLFLPIIPTTPLIILAAACYYRGSERLHAWILSSRWFGETIKNYMEGRGLNHNTKVRAIFLMWTTIIISAWLFMNNHLVSISIIGVAVGVTAYIIKLPTLEMN